MTALPASGPGRVAALDHARSAALLGMVIYHFTYDLELLGLIAPGTALSGGWAGFARIVAGSFLFLAGVSLHLAHGAGIRWRAFLRRLLVIGASAALITLSTYLLAPDRFIFFGILHSIAVASVAGLAFLRLPAAATVLAAVAVFLAPQFLGGGPFDSPWLVWLGLSAERPRTMDFEPVFPWLGFCLLGIAAARVAGGTQAWSRLSGPEAIPGRLSRALAWPGRHSLAIYLAHQPVLLSSLYGLRWLVG